MLTELLLTALAALSLTENFDSPSGISSTVGRGVCEVRNGVLYSKDAYAVLGSPEMKDYSFSFDARAPKDAEQVQIWAGFRFKDRFDRYAVGIKGGFQDDVYLMRVGYMGDDEFLGVRPLGFHPVPGEWYQVKVEVCGNRIRVFVGDENLPYIDVKDPQAAHCPAGPVTLGGAWIAAEFDNLRIEPMEEGALDGVKRREVSFVPSAESKKALRKRQRAGYRAVTVEPLAEGRTEISLDGGWLFRPGYETINEDAAVSPDYQDAGWHVMNVPSFWTPIRIWLHGEQMPTPNGMESKGTSDTYYQQETERCDNYSFDWNKTQEAWYRQWLELPSNIAGKKAVLHFDAVAKAAHVWVNGHYCASHIGMFGDFDVDVTEHLRPGRNLVAVKVIRNVVDKKDDDDEVTAVAVTIPVTKEMLRDVPHGFHYTCPPAGIWQPVKLVFTDPVKIEDVFIKPSLDGAEFEMTLSNPSRKRLELRTEIRDAQTHSILYEGRSIASTRDTLCTWSVSGLKPRLWSPQNPNLYDFRFSIVSKGRELDAITVTSGFRTFEAKDGFLWLNGHRYWLRGGNHVPSALGPYDETLANSFLTLMHRANIDVTRTHCAPWNEVWMDAADRIGIGVSHEGGWPWLMITGDIPSEESLRIWREEEYDLVRKYRNHPSLLFWTVNNEMNFYEWDQDKDRTREKYRIVSDVVKHMRSIDPTRPICFDSNYRSKGKEDKYGAEFMRSIDTGDMDDIHNYYNWYHDSVFQQFDGEFTKQWKAPGKRVTISQELSSGYPNNETGHPTRSYQITHQNPTSLVGYNTYDWADPAYFLEALSFTTGELAEALRRSNPEASGFLHFALMTWVRRCYDADDLEPYPIFDALSRALQPVLVSAEIWGRHLYAGERLPLRVCIVNDREDGNDLPPTKLRWEFVSAGGKVLSSGSTDVAGVPHYSRLWLEPEIMIPAIEGCRDDAKLRLRLCEAGIPVSENEYAITIGTRSYARTEKLEGMKFCAISPIAQLEELGVAYDLVSSPVKGSILVADASTLADAAQLRRFIDEGGSAVFLGADKLAREVFPEYITGAFTPHEGDICFMERNDDRVFEGVGEMDMRYYNDGTAALPAVCRTALKSKRCPQVEELAGYMDIHAYIDARPDVRMKQLDAIRGFSLERISSGSGSAMVSTICTEKAASDPLAARLLVNILSDAKK